LALVLGGIIILFASVAAGVGLILLMRRRTGDQPYFRDVGGPGAAFGAVRGPVAVLLAFVIFLAFQGYTRATTAARSEASAVLSMSRSADLLPPGNAGFLQRPLLCYARAVSEVGWPAMERGEESPLAEEWIAEAQRSIKQVKARTPAAHEGLTQYFEHSTIREAARDDRLAAVDGFVPTPVWIVLILGGVAVIGYVALFADPRESKLSQALVMGAVVAVISSGLLLIAFFDRPYADRPGSIKPTAMEATRDQLERDLQAKPLVGVLPCDESGDVIARD
jgi:hypothetical protein